jgi:hypothetical protein
VQAFRYLLAQRHLAALIYAAAILLRLLVPTGYMVAPDHGWFAITICSGMATGAGDMAMPSTDHAMAMAHGTMPDTGQPKDHDKPEMPCAFSGLSAQVLGSVDIVLLAIALAAVAIMALRAIPRVAPRAAPYLRPPLRGPPLCA